MSEGTRRREIWAVAPGPQPERRQDTMVEEAPVALYVGRRMAAELMCTPLDLPAWAAGYCLTMGWATADQDPPRIHIHERVVRVDLAVDAPPEAGARSAGGGPLGPRDAPPLPPAPPMELAKVMELTDRMARRQGLFRATGATHAAALYDADGGFISLGEDVGRHNALDKAVGAAWLTGNLGRAGAMALSGRISLEMAQKAARAGVAVIVSVSAATAPAVDRAWELGMCVMGFSRNGRVNVYCCPQRLLHDGAPLG